MHPDPTYPVPERVRAGSTSPIRDRLQYLEAVARATADPSGYWFAEAKARLAWDEVPTVGLEGGFATIAEAPFTWFADGKLNVTRTCVDRHLATRGDHVALLWEGDEPGTVRKITYRDLHKEVCKLANALKHHGIKKSDRVLIYMPMSIQVVIAMQACARIGATHSVVFGGFSTARLGTFRGGFQAFLEALAERVRSLGVEVRLVTQVERIEPQLGGGLRLRLAGEDLAFDRCLVTTSPALMARLEPRVCRPSTSGSCSRCVRWVPSTWCWHSSTVCRSRSSTGTTWSSRPASSSWRSMEHTNFMSPEHFGGDHIVYCGDYLEPDHEYFSLPQDELLRRFLPGLSRVNPRFTPY